MHFCSFEMCTEGVAAGSRSHPLPPSPGEETVQSCAKLLHSPNGLASLPRRWPRSVTPFLGKWALNWKGGFLPGCARAIPVPRTFWPVVPKELANPGIWVSEEGRRGCGGDGTGGASPCATPAGNC